MNFDQNMNYLRENPGKKGKPGNTDEQNTGSGLSFGVDGRDDFTQLSLDTDLSNYINNTRYNNEAESMFLSPLSEDSPQGFLRGQVMTTPTINIEQSQDPFGSLEVGSEHNLAREQYADLSPGLQGETEASQSGFSPFNSMLSPYYNDDFISTRSTSAQSVTSDSTRLATGHTIDVALSPAASRLTTGDDELDEILSVRSGNEPLDDLDYLQGTQDVALQFSDSFSRPSDKYFGVTDAPSYNERAPLRINTDFPKPQISVQEFQVITPADMSRTPLLSASSSPSNSFHSNPVRQNPNLLSVERDSTAINSDEEEAHDIMRQGRKVRRKSLQRSSRSPSSRRRSLSVDEKARSLSENRERLLELAALKPSKSHNDRSDDTFEDSSNYESADEGTSPLNATGIIRRKSLQKNASVYACELCDKKFTRPYNLKSHLRTHTDERPFSCAICGKAFARQHDRKRHEDLHTGQKRYTCHGKLKDGTEWGCGKKFARSDALGRHFKTEGGKRCIAPLYEEVTSEREAGRRPEIDLPIDI